MDPAGEIKDAPLIPTSTAQPLKKPHSVRTVHLALVTVQLGYAGLQIFSRVALVAGLNQFLLSMYRNIIAFLLLAPFAYFHERHIRPRMTLNIFIGLNLLALTGVVGSQQLFLAGLQLTSPLMAAVSQNMIPVCTFLLAAALGLEEVNIRRRDGRAKVVGTIICISGAIIMSVYKGVPIVKGNVPSEVGDNFTQPFKNLEGYLHSGFVNYSFNNYRLGMFFLVMNCVSWAAYLTLQGPVLRRYPAMFSMTAFTYMFGFIQVGVLGVISAGKLHFAQFLLTSRDQIVGVLYAAIVASTFNLQLQTWCVQKGGPFIVSLYVPLQMLMVSILSVLFLEDTLYMGICLGGMLTVAGFYMVVYGQGIERRRKQAALDVEAHGKLVHTIDIENLESNLKQPLLDK